MVNVEEDDVYEPQIKPSNPTSRVVELYDPDVTELAWSFFYLRTTVPSFEDGITLNQFSGMTSAKVA